MLTCFKFKVCYRNTFLGQRENQRSAFVRALKDSFWKFATSVRQRLRKLKTRRFVTPILKKNTSYRLLNRSSAQARSKKIECLNVK